MPKRGRKKGHTVSKATREKIKEKLKGVHTSPQTEFKKGAKRTAEFETKRIIGLIGRKLSETNKRRIGEANSISLKGKKHTAEATEKRKRKGEMSKLWKGGEKTSQARQNNRRNGMGFIPLYLNNDSKDYEWHHISPDKPYVVQCPTNIHKMIMTNHINHIEHFNYVNAFLGIIRVEDPDIFLFKHTDLESDIQDCTEQLGQ